MAADLLLLVNGTDNLLLTSGDDLLLASSTEDVPIDETGGRSVNATVGTAGGTITLTNSGKHLFVSNRHATAIVYFTVGAPGPGLPTTAVAAADDTYPCPAASTVRVPAIGGTTNVVSIISDTAATPVSVWSADIQPDHRGSYN